MVSLINHEYSRREAHGRFAWQSMPSNGLAITRAEQNENAAVTRVDDSTAAPGSSPCYAVLRRGRFRCCSSSFETARRVSFTCSVVRNSRATSASRTTTLVPSAYLAACLPLTPLLKSYSGRIVSSSRDSFRLVCFFIVLPFCPRCSACTYDSNLIFALRVRHDEQLHAMRHANVDKAIFILGVVWI